LNTHQRKHFKLDLSEHIWNHDSTNNFGTTGNEGPETSVNSLYAAFITFLCTDLHVRFHKSLLLLSYITQNLKNNYGKHSKTLLIPKI
jgi:hypothetical protein